MTKLTANRIIDLLETPTRTRFPIKVRIRERASSEELISALRQATTPLTREILCDIVGEREERDAVPTLIEFLQDASSGVRSSAADALGKIGDSRAGPAMMKRFAGEESDPGVRQMLASGLGAVGYRPAIPLLIEALEDDDKVLRGGAAWSLGALGAGEAEEALRRALSKETKVGYANDRLREALASAEMVNAALKTTDKQAALSILIPALETPTLRMAAAWALSQIGGSEARAAVENSLAQEIDEDMYLSGNYSA